MTPVPLMSDNYAYLLIDHATGHVAAVDPADADAVCHAFESEKVRFQAAGIDLQMKMVLCTHKHHDHAGGNVEMRQHFPKLEVVGGALEEVAGRTRTAADGDELQLGSVAVRVVHTPCHTAGHIVFFCSHAGTDATVLFSGDVLFVGGAGKFFEGTADQMLTNLQKIAQLPSSTLLFCGHE